VDEHLSLVKCELASTKCELVQARKDAAAAEKKIILTEKRVMMKVIAHVGELLADLSDKLETKVEDLEFDGRKMVKNLELQLYNSMKQIHRDCNPWILKLNSLDTMSKSGKQVAPVIFKMSDYSKYKKDKEWWYSPPFHANNKGAVMSMAACPAGFDTGQGTHLSVFLFLIKEPQHNCGWLSRGEFKIQLLNQHADGEHHVSELAFSDHNKTNDTVSNTLQALKTWRIPQFIAYENLSTISTKRSFLKFDCLYFEVHVKSSPEVSNLPYMQKHPLKQVEPSSLPISVVSQIPHVNIIV